MDKLTKNIDINLKKVVVLIGHMGSGKSTIGKILAKKLNWRFYDSDREIEKKQKKSIEDIFKEKGETYFRKLEKIYISKLVKRKKSVIAIGGGSVKVQKIRKILKKETISIFLKVDIETLLKRLKNKKNRPLLFNTNVEKKIKFLDSERLQIYNEANIIIENSKNIQETIEKICNCVRKEKSKYMER